MTLQFHLQTELKEHMICDLIEHRSNLNSLAHSRNAFTVILFMLEVLAVDI